MWVLQPAERWTAEAKACSVIRLYAECRHDWDRFVPPYRRTATPCGMLHMLRQGLNVVGTGWGCTPSRESPSMAQQREPPKAHSLGLEDAALK